MSQGGASLYQDHILQAVLQGNLTSVPEPPSRVLKILVASTRLDLDHERRVVQENVVPELQRHCASLGLDVQLLDLQQGPDPRLCLASTTLQELEDCHARSLGCFLICLIGNKYGPLALPDLIESSTFEQVHNAAQEAGLDVSPLANWYLLNENLVHPAYELQVPQTPDPVADRTSEPDGCILVAGDPVAESRRILEEQEQVSKVLRYGARVALDEGLIDVDTERQFRMSNVHTILDRALRLSKAAPHRIICVVRQFDGINMSDASVSSYVDVSAQDGGCTDEETSLSADDLVADIILNVNKKNVHYYCVPWQASGLDPEFPEHGGYLEKLAECLLSSVKQMVDDASQLDTPDWDELPPTFRKVVQEVVRESQTHLCNSRQLLGALGVSQSLDSDYGPLLQIQRLMLADEERARHTPIIVCGREGCGKSTLLSQVLMYCPEWLGNDVVRIIRGVGQSPFCAYTAEILRNLCLHISMVFGFEISPKHHSFELSKLSIWFQDLLKLVETTTSDLVIVLDDLHQLKCPPNNQAAILGWLPWNLPLNVHIVCSVAEEAEGVLGLLRSRISTSDSYVHIPSLQGSAAASMLQSNLKDHKRTLTKNQWGVVRDRLAGQSVCPLYVTLLSQQAKRWSSYEALDGDMHVPGDIGTFVNRTLEKSEKRFGFSHVKKIASYLTCTSYGLREPEIVELLSCSECEASQREFLPVNWLSFKRELGVLLRESYVDCRSYLQWSHRCIGACVRKRYLAEPEDAVACHTDLANAFHLGFLMQKDEKGPAFDDSNKSKRKEDWSDLLREVDELWNHLFQSGDVKRLNQDAVCNFEFLLSAVRGASISYVRSVLEIVRAQLLDWEIELLYNMTKQSVDVLSQDPQQLATEILNWLRPYADGNSKVLEDLVSQANSWCNQAKTPLLVPLTSWLSLTLPPQVTSMSLPSPLKHLVAVPDSQHVFCTTEADNRVISMYHVTSKKLVRQLSGHKATITCLHMSASGRHLVSGSEDTDVLIWDPVLGTLQRRLSHHVAGVLCVATTHSEDFVLSGSEIGVVVVARLDTGQLVQRLENHRGVVNAVAVNKGDDIFATASSDCTVCVWCLEDFTLLNSIALPSAIVRLCISSDSTFLLLACADNVVRVRSLTTGSDVHCLQGYTGRVSTLSFARDNCRCVVGTGDGKAFVFDIHSARLVQTLVAHQDSAVVAIQAQSKDTFLITAAGNKIVVWNFYLKRSEMCHPQPKAKKVDVHKDPVSCVALSRDGSMGVTGSRNGQIKVWQMSIGEPHTNLEGHTAAITCLVFAPNGLFVVSGSEDNTVRVWGLSLGVLACTFKEHQSKPVSVFVTSDSRRILSVDAQGVHRLWTADNATQLIMCTRTCKQVILHANMVFNVGGKSDNSLKYWPVMDTESEKTVSHSEAILCYTVTYDCQTVVTGSQDMSLKVWEVATAKLTQVLVGHEGPVTCVAVAPFRSSLAVSGSQDCNLIVWDMTTGSDNFILRGHTESIKATKLTLDGTVAVSCSDDNTLQLWNTQNGHRIASFDLHATMLVMTTSLNTNHLIIQLASSTFVPMLKMLNNPGKGLMLDLPPGTPVSDESKTLGLHLRGMMPKRVLLRGNLKREQSFDSFYWDLRAQSPKHETVDDFRMKPLSPFGSREHLHLSGTTPVWNGGVSTGRGLRPGGHPSDLGLQPKPKLPKHKILKKQQSMFACFPEFTQQAPPTLISPVTTAKDIVEKKELLLGKPSRVAAAMTLPRTNSVEEAPEKAQDEGAVGPENTVTDSAVCVVM
ncbi:NACHT domain- and WD repeat-containing protein 1 [Ixodes scapularis]|uniref:NACHT domain- and WD repeat-containing protein 1 n=1 Tax=Ixodes scapularis TaxID=6945 RepID=UPI001C388874|nr:NACHT domain- and WD repeat-containing protein 1 [Ixodes scapularis]